MKCLDLMTGENLFLLDPRESNQPDVKGMTLCSGIAPAGRYHINLGMYHPANFDERSDAMDGEVAEMFK